MAETNRRPLVRKTPRGWFFQNSSSRRYLLRELTALPMAAFAIHLLCGLVALSRGPEVWAAWLAYSRHPLVLAATAIALAATILHAVTWFSLSAAVVKVAPKPVIVGLQVTFALVALGAAVTWLAVMG
ncbi:MAG: hypothetical protein FWG11_04990 [Promicromonosporaceae bacterium]|jgi:fumarate reductase subunit C|nr:hypothetical protein [Promicromonosporaceae bacterium]